jgi:hypothetical protein
MVLHKFGDRLYSGVQEALRSHLRGVAGDVVNAQGTPFLQELVSRWNDHNKSTQMIRDILMVRTSSRTVCTGQCRTGQGKAAAAGVWLQHSE